MGQCQGKTKKGERCRRDARDSSGFCAIHADQETHERAAQAAGEWDRDAIMKAALGLAVVGLIFMFRFRR